MNQIINKNTAISPSKPLDADVSLNGSQLPISKDEAVRPSDAISSPRNSQGEHVDRARACFFLGGGLFGGTGVGALVGSTSNGSVGFAIGGLVGLVVGYLLGLFVAGTIEAIDELSTY